VKKSFRGREGAPNAQSVYGRTREFEETSAIKGLPPKGCRLLLLLFIDYGLSRFLRSTGSNVRRVLPRPLMAGLSYVSYTIAVQGGPTP